MKNIQKLLVTLMLILSGTFLYSQNHVIKGTVKDEKGNALEFASVVIKGSQNGTMSDSAGKFSLTTPTITPTLVISSIGYETKEVLAKGNFVEIQISSLNTSLDAFVVVGSRNPKKSKLETPVPVDVVNLIKMRGYFAAIFSKRYINLSDTFL